MRAQLRSQRLCGPPAGDPVTVVEGVLALAPETVAALATDAEDVARYLGLVGAGLTVEPS